MNSTGAQRFPLTRLTLFEQLRDSAEQNRNDAFGLLVELYWLPVYKYVRIKWKKSTEDAQDLTQEFFTRAMEKGFFTGFDPGKARFRTFLRTCLDGFAANEWKAQKAIKRGGRAMHVDVDWRSADNELNTLKEQETPETLFEKEWIRSIFRLALHEFRTSCETQGKLLNYQLLERYDIESHQELSYKELASEFGTSVSQITNHLAEARREFRKIILEVLRRSTASNEEFRREARALLGIEIE